MKSYYSMKKAIQSPRGDLAKILDKVVEIQQIQARISEYMPADMAANCQVANFRQGCLVLVTESAAWATRMRYEIPQLLQALRAKAGMHSLGSITIQVRPGARSRYKLPKKRVKLSANGAEAIQNVAASIEDSDLKSALKRLSENAS